MVRIVCMDDNPASLHGLVKNVREIAAPECDVCGFEDARSALEFVKNKGCDVLFCEIEFNGSPNGLSFAKRIKELRPHVNIVFLTVCSANEYANEVLDLRPSGYLTKPATKEQIAAELKALRYPLSV
ncbi:MAG: response regulator [Candidatus Scatosoma sp.]